MVKLNVNVSYNEESHIFVCSQQSVLKKAGEYFNVDTRDVELYSVKRGERKKITPHDITDLMVIEMVHKQSAMGSQRTLRSYYENESLLAKYKDAIITKLKNNNALTGEERKQLVEWLQTNPDKYSTKRNSNEINSRAEVQHKKIQVNFSIISCKDSFAQTDQMNITEKRASDETVQNKIKRLATSSDVDKDEVASLMTASFEDRRNFIFFKLPPVALIKDRYPLLFSLDEVKNELGRIFYAEKCEEFIRNIHMYAPLIIQKCNPDHDIYRLTMKYIDRALSDLQKKYAKAVGSIFILTILMEEDRSFIHLNNYPHGSENVYPHIDASCYDLKELFFDNLLYRIIVEGQMLCEANNLLEAILCLIASFFIFNIDYPENCRRTLAVFEKLYLNANDTEDIDDLTTQTVKLLQLQAKSGM